MVTDVTPSELLECARLLAISVAHHRAKFGVIPLATSSDRLRERKGEPAMPGLRESALEAFKEALDLVRGRAEKHRKRVVSTPKVNASASGNEQRRQMRISASAPVRIGLENSDHQEGATLMNISWGGAGVRCAKPVGAAGDQVRVLLPADRGNDIDILATVLRVSQVDDHYEFGLRFDSLSPEDEERLQHVLELLIGSPPRSGRRVEPRLVQRLEIEYGDAGELRATLEDLSASGLSLTVPEPLELDQSLLVSLNSTDTAFGLSLRARVMHQTVIEGPGMDMYRVGLQFEHPTPQLRQRIASVIRELAILKPEVLDVPGQTGPPETATG